MFHMEAAFEPVGGDLHFVERVGVIGVVLAQAQGQVVRPREDDEEIDLEILELRTQVTQLHHVIARQAGYLVNACLPNGSFRYRDNMDPDVEVRPRYHVLRHAGAIHALNEYDRWHADPVVRQTAERAGRYLKDAREAVPPRAIATLRRARGRGGWNLELRPTGRDDVDATAIIIRAMRAAGIARNDRDLRAATTWLRRQAHSRGGFDSRGGRRPAEANSTAAAIVALTVMGRSSTRARRDLRRLQKRSGAFDWKLRTPGSRTLATLDAVTALSR